MDGRDAAWMADHEARRAAAYEQSVWLALAISNPKKMPKFEPLKKREIPKEAQTEMVRAWFMSKVK